MKKNNSSGGRGYLCERWHVALLFAMLPIAVIAAHICSIHEGCPGDSSVVQVAASELGADYTYSDLSIVVNIPATEMTLFEGSEEVFSRKVAVGAFGFQTPEKETSIKVIEWNPWWYPPKAPWAKGDKPTPPGPKNPLGPVKIRVGTASEILMHGTNKSWSVGRAASHGCMRMYNDDASSLAWFLQRKYSKKNDPALLATYKNKRGSTFRVELDREIPIKLVYDPVVIREGNLILYPDHYRKIADTRKSVLLSKIVASGLSLEEFDDSKLEDIVKDWPTSKKEIPLSDLLIAPPKISFLSAPECS